MLLSPVLSLFTIVSFKNDACSSLSGNNGTCYSAKVNKLSFDNITTPVLSFTSSLISIPPGFSKIPCSIVPYNKHNVPRSSSNNFFHHSAVSRTVSSKGGWGQALVQVDLVSAAFVSWQSTKFQLLSVDTESSIRYSLITIALNCVVRVPLILLMS